MAATETECPQWGGSGPKPRMSGTGGKRTFPLALRNSCSKEANRMETGLEDKFAAVLTAMGAALAPLGFKKRRRSFRIQIGANTCVIESQRSTANEEGCLRFTLNLAVLSAAVAAKNDQKVEKLGAWDGHLQERIGVLTGAGDKWWRIERTTDADMLAAEVVTAVRNIAVPFLDRHASDDTLRALWETGQSPGLTAVQRQRNLAALTG